MPGTSSEVEVKDTAKEVCNYAGSERGAYCDLPSGHDGGHYFHSPRSREDRVYAAAALARAVAAEAEVERLRGDLTVAVREAVRARAELAGYPLAAALAGATPEGDPPTEVRGFCVCDGDGPKLDCGNPEHRSTARSAAVVQATPEQDTQR
jgi:hypothetical protein